jgi:NAD(P)-dependent dehydrogenase (short-subunit alcohol dehydrogenase family)
MGLRLHEGFKQAEALMTVRLKPLAEQVMVITGASSGIGLVTANLAASAGASVVLAARNERDLQKAVAGIRTGGGRAVYAVADVSVPEQVAATATKAIEAFGRIDTWVNNAAVSLYGRIMDLPIEDVRRQFDVNYWGTVYGSRAAVPYLARQGGALVNVASVLADRAIPLQGNYCASKHAIKAFTDTLRMELEAEGIPISVSLVKPGSTDTPFFQKARTYMDHEPQPVPPVHAPEVPAHAILTCATREVRDVLIGGAGKMTTLLGTLAPRLVDYYMEDHLFEDQQAPEAIQPGRPDNLYRPVADDGGPRGRYHGHVMKSSIYTTAALHPLATALGLAAGALAGISFARRRSLAT